MNEIYKSSLKVVGTTGLLNLGIDHITVFHIKLQNRNHENEATLHRKKETNAFGSVSWLNTITINPKKEERYRYT